MKVKQIAIIIAFFSIGIFIIFSVKQLQTSALLTKEQMIDQVETVFNGSVQSFIEKENYYLASFERSGSTYEVKIDPHNGELSNMQAIFITDKPIVAVKDDYSTTPNKNAEPVEGEKLDDVSKPNNQANPAITTKPNDAAGATPDSKPIPTENPKETPSQQTKPLLSAAQAKAIALKEVKGEVDSIDYKATSDGGHYFIEIDLEDDDMDEAYVQVHAITGKILSIQFED
ncbi:PepSY domain-containing protein [Solibacillus sp. FSL K6-1523]|uniref:PepSY domain-containing protein n=1 Tax=Solibacillus sp. FSL K6-1523 TaxID=2921471 RepID=UPI0030F8BF35